MGKVEKVDPRIGYYQAQFQMTPKQMRVFRWDQKLLDQLACCRDDSAQRVLLGVGRKFEPAG